MRTRMRMKPSLTADDVKKMLGAAEAEAVKHKWPIAIAIVDEGAHPMARLRLHGANPMNVETALAKAKTAVLSRRPSKHWQEFLESGRMMTLALPVMPAGGGVPIMVDGDCVGAIATAGAKPEFDERVVEVA